MENVQDFVLSQMNAVKEIEETAALSQYIEYMGLDYDDEKNYRPKIVRMAVKWRRDRGSLQ